MSIFENYKRGYKDHGNEELTIQQYLDLCKTNPETYATAAERMLKAIGEPEVVNTADDPRLSRIFSNRKIKRYPAFAEFYGMEDVIEQVVSYFKHNAQGLEERKNILYLLGPVGSGKSSVAEKLKKLIEHCPIYTLKARNATTGQWEISPLYESPLGLFNVEEHGEILSSEYNIPKRYINTIMSPWAVKRLKEMNGDITDFKIVKMWPSVLNQVAITKTEPGDENNQDISTLVGKVDIRKLEDFSQDDPDAYSYAGGLNVATQGLLEFVEMFKAPIKMLHPLLTATQEGHYNGTQGFGAIPFQGIVMAHCFSEDTELLTSSGWRNKDEVNVGDLLATLNRDTGMIEYQPGLNKFEQDYMGDMYHMSSSSADHLVTPNHKMVYESYGSYKECLAEDFFVKGAKVPISGMMHNVDLDYYESDDELRLHVQCVTDGYISYIKPSSGSLSYRFSFKKERKINRLSELLTRMDIPFKVSTWADGVTAIMCTLPSKYTKQLSDIHRQLSPRQTSVLLEEWSYTNGTGLSHKNEDSFQLSTNVKFHKDLIQELAVKSGHKTICALSLKEGYDPVYMLCVRMNTTTVRSDAINKGTVEYSGKVWCMETANHTLIARRNGKVMITGNSNESEWDKFKNDKSNEAFLDRVCIIKVPYCLRVSDEIEIYKKLLRNSTLSEAITAPGTLEMMSQFSVLSRIVDPENSNIYSKMRIYDGENLKDTDPKAKSIQEYRDNAGVNEGMRGLSTRFAYKCLSKVYNFDSEELAANPVHLMYILQKTIEHESLESGEVLLKFIKGYLAPKYAEFIGEELQKAYLESYSEYGQNLFDRYVQFADFWIQDQDFRDPQTGEMFDRAALNEELEKIEKPAAISNPKDFRNEVVNFVLRARANLNKNPDWKSYEKLRVVIEKRMFSNTEDLLPVISFGTKKNKDEEMKHNDFVQRMVDRGYTQKQVRLLVEWYQRYKKHS